VIAKAQNRPLWTALVGVPLLFASIAAMQTRIDARTGALQQEPEEVLVRSDELVKKMSLGYDSLLADIYWTRAVQYYGYHVDKADHEFSQLWPLLDITTTLDPHLVVAYRFGAIFLSEKVVGAGRTDLAIELVKRGIAANPDEWRLSTDLGFLYYWSLKNYPEAVNAYVQAAQNPQSPPWVKAMAARIAATGGSIETSQLIWSQIYESSQDMSMRNLAYDQLRILHAQQDQAHLDEIADQYRQKTGHPPTSSKDLIAAGLLSGTPVDSEGFAYVFGPDGKSQVNPQSPIAALIASQNKTH